MATPAFKIHVQKKTELEALEDSYIGKRLRKIVIDRQSKVDYIIKKYNNPADREKIPQYISKDDLQYQEIDPKVWAREKLKEMLNSEEGVLSENQVKYAITLAKQSYARLQAGGQAMFADFDLYEKRAKMTFEVVMTEMGLDEVGQKILQDYEEKFRQAPVPTMLKILYRCALGYRALNKVQKIFSMLQKKNDLLSMFIKK